MASPAETVYPRPYIWRATIAFALGWIIVYADRTALYPMLPVVAGEYGLSGAQTGLITSAYFIFYVGMNIPAGLIGDRIGLKRALLATYLLAGVALALLGLFAVSYVTLLIFVGLHGLGMGGYYAPSYGMTMATVPKESRGISSGIVSMGMSIGIALGLAFSGWLYEATQNWHLSFLLLTVPTLAMVAIFATVLADVRHGARGAPVSFFEVVRDRDVALLTFADFSMLWADWVVISWGPTFFKNERGLDLGAAGMFTALSGLGAIAGALALGAMSDRIGRRRLTLVVLPIAALALFALGQINSLPLLALAILLYGFFGPHSWHSVFIAWAGDYIAARRPQAMGAAIGFVNAVAVSSAILSPPLSGWLKDATNSLGPAFYLAGGVILCGAVACLFVNETVKRSGAASYVSSSSSSSSAK